MSLRVKLHKNGTVAISGIDYRDLRSILTSASLHHFDNPFVPEEETGPYAVDIKDNNDMARAWVKNQHHLIDFILKLLAEQIENSHPKTEPTKAQRLKKAKKDRDFRKRCNELFNEYALAAQERKESV